MKPATLHARPATEVYLVNVPLVKPRTITSLDKPVAPPARLDITNILLKSAELVSPPALRAPDRIVLVIAVSSGNTQMEPPAVCHASKTVKSAIIPQPVRLVILITRSDPLMAPAIVLLEPFQTD